MPLCRVHTARVVLGTCSHAPHSRHNRGCLHAHRHGADGTCHGLLLLNSNALEVVLHRRRLSFRALGGLLDLFVFLGPRPEEVLRQYQAVVGRPAMPPYWALGFHQSRCSWDCVCRQLACCGR